MIHRGGEQKWSRKRAYWLCRGSRELCPQTYNEAVSRRSASWCKLRRSAPWHRGTNKVKEYKLLFYSISFTTHCYKNVIGLHIPQAPNPNRRLYITASHLKSSSVKCGNNKAQTGGYFTWFLSNWKGFQAALTENHLLTVIQAMWHLKVIVGGQIYRTVSTACPLREWNQTQKTLQKNNLNKKGWRQSREEREKSFTIRSHGELQESKMYAPSHGSLSTC